MGTYGSSDRGLPLEGHGMVTCLLKLSCRNVLDLLVPVFCFLHFIFIVNVSLNSRVYTPLLYAASVIKCFQYVPLNTLIVIYDIRY